MQRVEALGDAALDEMMAKGDASLANKILVDRRQRTVGTQAGDRGIAMDVWPGITGVLCALPAKTNVFEWLKESEKFCKAVVELAMEIAMDNGWKHNYAQMQEEIVRAQNQRKFGEYVADSRAKARLHAQE